MSIFSVVEILLVALCVKVCIPPTADFVLTALYSIPSIAVSHETATCSNLMIHFHHAEGLDLLYSG